MKALQDFWKNEKGAMTTVEIIGYTLLIGGAVAMVGFGMTAMARGKTGNIFNAVQDTKAMSGNITDTSGYSYTATTDTATGMQTGGAGN